MFKPVIWKTFPRDFIVIQFGFALFGLSIALMIRSNIGTTPWAVLEVALSQLTNIRPGRISIMVGLVVLLGSLTLRERIGWGSEDSISPSVRESFLNWLSTRLKFRSMKTNVRLFFRGMEQAMNRRFLQNL